MTAVECSALWIGRELGPLGAACLRSFVKVGVPITLYVYDEPIDVPHGVRISDAEAIIQRQHIFRHRRTGSYAIFADMFRYELLQQVNTIYVDTDVYCVRSPPDQAVTMGWQNEREINNAVLRLPPGSPLLADMQSLFTSRFRRPPWIGRRKFWTLAARAIAAGDPLARHLPWGVTGPTGLTYFAKARGLDTQALPKDVFYPVEWNEVDKLTRPDLKLSDLITPQTSFIHLFNEQLRGVSFEAINYPCPLQEILAA